MSLLDLGTLLAAVGCGLVAGPRNAALAVVTPTSSEAARLWVAYLSTWTAWNHVRTTAALAAAVLFTLALRLRA